MISIPRLFGLVLLFLFFEVVVLVLSTLFLPEMNVLVVCSVMTAIVVAIWVVYIVVMRWMMRPRIPATPPRPAISSSAPAAAAPGNDPESTVFRELIRQAEDRLASSTAFAGRKTKPTLKELPLYLAIGSEAAGKTSAILNSGLDPRLLVGESYRDGAVTPTQACNFYYAENAVIVDVATRVFDSAESWRRLLAVLFPAQKKPLFRRIWEGNTPPANLRGVVLFCDANTFSRSTDLQRAVALSHKIQERLDTLGKQMQAEFPVYVLFTKSDLLPYFDSFFYRLSDEEDREILGCTIPAVAPLKGESADTPVEAERKRLSKYFSRLCASLANKRLPFLARESVSTRKPAIYEFPRELKRIRPEITGFLVETFRPNPLQPGARLRGFYFSGTRSVPVTQPAEETSGFLQTRIGAAATVLLRTTELRAGTQGVIRPPLEPTIRRWVFLTKLFREIILPDTALAPARRPDTQLETYRSVALGAVAVVCLLLTAAFVTSMAQNRRLLSDVAAAMYALRAAPPDPNQLSLESLRRMDTLREKIASLTAFRKDGPPLRLRWGLYSGNHALADARTLYFAEFRKVFAAPLLNSLRLRFDNLSPSSATYSYDVIYEQLKAYRTITSRACRPDTPLLARLLPSVWLMGRTLEPESESLARRQIAFYVSELAIADPYGRSLPEDAAATKQAQSFLLSFKGPDKIYRALITAVNQSPELHAVRLAQYAPDFASVLNGPSEVPAAFTRQGWDTVNTRIRDKNFSSVGESCVVGHGQSSDAFSSSGLQSDLQTLYVQNYIRTWRDFLAGQSVNPYRGLSDAVHKLNILAGNRSPILAVLAMIADNTNLPAAAPSGADQVRKRIENTVESGLARLFLRVKKGAGIAKKTLAPDTPPALSETDIVRVFQPVRTLVVLNNRDRLIADSNRTYINALSDLKTALDALPRDRTAALDVSLNNQAKQALDKAHAAVRDLAQRFNINTAQGTDIELTRLLEMPINFADSFVPKDPHKPLRDKVNAQLRAVCGRLTSLQRKFPFNPQAEAEVSEQELAALFAPGSGALWSFEQLPSPLAGLLIKQGDLWMQNPAVQDPHLTPEFLDFFTRLSNISAALYPAGSGAPRIHYSVRTLLSENVQAVTINVGGTVVSSTGQAVPITWPSPPDAAFVELQVTINGVRIPFGRYDGQWAIFRMMQDGRPESTGSNVYVLRDLRQGHGKPQPLQAPDGSAVAVRVAINFATAFDPRHFRIACPAVAAN